jgi:hypothetical protein
MYFLACSLADFRFQLKMHYYIRKSSQVDLLITNNAFLTVQRATAKSRQEIFVVMV